MTGKFHMNIMRQKLVLVKTVAILYAILDFAEGMYGLTNTIIITRYM